MSIDRQSYDKSAKWPINYGYDRRLGKPSSIVVHTTNGSVGSSFDAEARFLRDSPKVSAHYLIGKDGHIAQILAPDKWRAWHAGVAKVGYGNNHSIGIEQHYTPGEPKSQMQINSLTSLTLALMAAFDIASMHVVTHRWAALPEGRKVDPSNMTDAEFEAWRSTLTAPATYSAATPILGTARIPLNRWISAFQNHEHGAYTPADIAAILTEYDRASTRLGINRDVALAQLAHETDWLSSWWAQRPRRNPAGIGVSGEISRSRPDGGEWVRRDDGFWTKGQSFSNWQTGSIPAHLGRLLAYSLPDGGGTRMQQDVMGYALGVRGLPEDFRGSAPTLQGLDGKWAPRRGYGQSVADRANEVAR